MDWLTFISQVVAACAWPAVVICLFLFLRNPISDLLLELRKLKWNDLEAEFGERLSHARELIEQQANLPAITSNEFSSESRSKLMDLAALSPRAVVVESWREVESAAARFLSTKASEGDKRAVTTSAVNGKKLAELGALETTEFQVFSILRHLRNQAAHDLKFEINKDEAIEYAIMAQALASAIDERGRK